MTHHATDTNVFAAGAVASFWWVVDMVARHGPSWEAVPPILVGTASLVGALKCYANDSQARRHKEERHRLELKVLERGEVKPAPETVPPPAAPAPNA